MRVLRTGLPGQLLRRSIAPQMELVGDLGGAIPVVGTAPTPVLVEAPAPVSVEAPAPVLV
jgi:hypothetical protein